MRRANSKHPAPSPHLSLAELRVNAGRTQEQCAAALGIGQSSYAKMEGGSTPLRRRDRVTLAVFFGVPLREAFPDEEDEPRRKAA